MGAVRCHLFLGNVAAVVRLVTYVAHWYSTIVKVMANQATVAQKICFCQLASGLNWKHFDLLVIFYCCMTFFFAIGACFLVFIANDIEHEGRFCLVSGRYLLRFGDNFVYGFRNFLFCMSVRVDSSALIQVY